MNPKSALEKSMEARRALHAAPVVKMILAAAAVAACSGNAGDAPGADPASASGGTTAASAGAGNVTAGTSATGAAPSAGPGSAPAVNLTAPQVAESAGALVMRRLTYREYDHMLARLLGDTTRPASGANSWSADTAGQTGFVAPSDVARYHVTQFNQTADALVDTAVKNFTAGQKTGKFTLSAACKAPAAAAEAGCATEFITAFGLQAYRRPVAPAEQADLLSLFSSVRSAAKFSFIDSIGAVAKAMLQSPNFLYHWELGGTPLVVGSDGLVALSPWQIAARLSTALWESMPDDALFTAAQTNQLATSAQVSAQVERMLADPQAVQALYNFHLQWFFNMGFHVTDLEAVDAKPNSLLTAGAAQGLFSEFTRFLGSVYAPPGDGTLNTLYTASYAFVNKDLAAIYGVQGPATGFAKVNLDPAQRAGIFTQVSFLAGIEDSIADNPVYRGLALYTKALCGHMDPPPPNIPGVNFTSGGTTRQAYDAHGSSACAKQCHAVFDPPGFAFENYDGVGQYRTTEGGQAVDSSGTFAGPLQAAGLAGGTTFTFKNAIELSKQLAASPEAQTCVDRQWSRYVLGRLETAADQGSLQTAYKKGTATAGFSVRDMLVTLLSSKAFMYRKLSDGETI